MNRHLFTAAEIVLVAGQLMTHLLDREAAPQECSSLAVLREDKIMVFQRSCCADTGRLFSKLGHVEGDPSLALGCIVDDISLVDGHHLVVHL